LLPNQKIQIGENFEMKKTILLASLIFIAFDATIPSFAYNETDLEKLKKLNACERCDLSEAYLHGTKLSGAFMEQNLVEPT